MLGGKHLGEVRVFKCVICGAAFSSKFGLMGHVRCHKGGFKRFCVSLPVGDVEWFKDFARRHNSTTCHLLKTMIDAFRKGEELGVVKVGSPNPVVVNLYQMFLGKPRSGWKVEVPPSREAGPVCPSCTSQDVCVFRQSGSGLIEGRCSFCGVEWLLSDRKSGGRVLEG